MTRLTRSAFLAAALVASAIASPESAEAQGRTHAVIISGLGGEERYRTRFNDQAVAIRRALIDRHGLPAEDVIVHVLMMGGSFGHRLEDEVVKQATEIAMQMKGTPVQLPYSRDTDMTHDFPRQIAMARVRGTVRDGGVESFDLSIAMPSCSPAA